MGTPIPVPAAVLIDKPPAEQLELVPLEDTVLFRILDPRRTEAGLYVPENASDHKRMVVLAVGPGRVLEDGTRVMPGFVRDDQILIWPHAAKNLWGNTITGEPVYFCRVSDVAAVVVPKKGLQ